jgi:MYXO-CTERM domain-containing protein
MIAYRRYDSTVGLTAHRVYTRTINGNPDGGVCTAVDGAACGGGEPNASDGSVDAMDGGAAAQPDAAVIADAGGEAPAQPPDAAVIADAGGVDAGAQPDAGAGHDAQPVDAHASMDTAMADGAPPADARGADRGPADAGSTSHRGHGCSTGGGGNDSGLPVLMLALGLVFASRRRRPR